MTENEQRWLSFPNGLRDIFEGLWQEAVSLHAHWELYLDLFGDPDKIHLLNDTVPSVFQLIEENLCANITVSIGRLTDPSKTRKKDNLSLARLVESLHTHCKTEFANASEMRLAAIKAVCEPINAHRNRRVAHNDLETVINYHDNPLPGIGRDRIANALTMIADLMNSIQLHFEEGETAYDHGIQRGTGKDLIYLLEQALEYDHKQQAEELAKYGIVQ